MHVRRNAMPAPNILIGGESFRELRERNCYYIDKTDLLVELLSQVPAKVSLFTRPAASEKR